MNRVAISTTVVVISALAILAFFMLKSTDDKAAPAETTPAAAITVTEATATEFPWQDAIKATGAIAAWQEAVTGAEISGQRLVAVMADVGDSVKKGQVLAKFNTETLQVEYAELKANWAAAESNHRRALVLKKSGAMSDRTTEDAVNRAAVTKAQLDAKALQLNYTDVVAPDDGVISARNATLGAVGASGDALFRLIRQNRLEWHGELTAEQAARAKQGQPVVLTLPNGSKTEGITRQIAPSYNPETRMTTIFVDIPNDSAAKAGMYAEGVVTLGQTIALSVPAKSVVLRDGRHYVFILNAHRAGATVTRHEVQVGQIRGDEAQILSGLSKGARIVWHGAGFLNDGDTVRVVPAKGGQ